MPCNSTKSQESESIESRQTQTLLMQANNVGAKVGDEHNNSGNKSNVKNISERTERTRFKSRPSNHYKSTHNSANQVSIPWQFDWMEYPCQISASLIPNRVYELDGQFMYKIKKEFIPSFHKTFQSPNCVFNILAQTYRYKGKPWCKQNFNYRKQSKDIYEGLHTELEDFYDFMKPFEYEKHLRKATFCCIANSIRQTPNVNIRKVKYYGSYSSNTYLPVSDIDIVVDCMPSMDNVVMTLTNFACQLFKDGIIAQTCSMIPYSRVPLLKFYDSLTGIPINITINTPLVMERAYYIYDNIRPSSYKIKLLYFLKFYLLHKNTNQVFHGGIGSYALSLMVIRFFQEKSTQEMINSKTYRKSILGHLLIGFLKRFGDVDFFRTHKISVIGEGAYIPIHSPKLEESNQNGKKTSVLYIEDHLEPWKNVSSGSFNSDLILKDFGVMLDNLLSNEPSNDVSILGKAITVVDSFVNYRYILGQLYHIWTSTSGRPRIYRCIAKRNFFGKRPINYVSNYSPDTIDIQFETNDSDDSLDETDSSLNESSYSTNHSSGSITNSSSTLSNEDSFRFLNSGRQPRSYFHQGRYNHRAYNRDSNYRNRFRSNMNMNNNYSNRNSASMKNDQQVKGYRYRDNRRSVTPSGIRSCKKFNDENRPNFECTNFQSSSHPGMNNDKQWKHGSNRSKMNLENSSINRTQSNLQGSGDNRRNYAGRKQLSQINQNQINFTHYNCHNQQQQSEYKPTPFQYQAPKYQSSKELNSVSKAIEIKKILRIDPKC